jgi:hypothetical protein
MCHSQIQLKLLRTIHVYVCLAKIHVPEVAYTFVAAMDRLIGQLPVETPANPSAGSRKMCQQNWGYMLHYFPRAVFLTSEFNIRHKIFYFEKNG